MAGSLGREGKRGEARSGEAEKRIGSKVALARCGCARTTPAVRDNASESGLQVRNVGRSEPVCIGQDAPSRPVQQLIVEQWGPDE
jgi:hypothetical protein